MYVELHLLGRFAGDKSRKQCGAVAGGTAGRCRRDVSVFVESGWDSRWFSGHELSPVLGKSTGESPWSHMPDSEDSHGESFFKIQLWELPGCRVALCHAWIGVAPSGVEVSPVLPHLFPPLTSLLCDSPPRLGLGACSMVEQRELARWQVSHPSVGLELLLSQVS